jgi:hypothetical protein
MSNIETIQVGSELKNELYGIAKKTDDPHIRAPKHVIRHLIDTGAQKDEKNKALETDKEKAAALISQLIKERDDARSHIWQPAGATETQETPHVIKPCTSRNVYVPAEYIGHNVKVTRMERIK